MARRVKSQINILVADDDDDDCLLVELAFKEALPGVHVSFVSDGEKVFDYLDRCKQAENACPDLHQMAERLQNASRLMSATNVFPSLFFQLQWI